MTEGLALRFAKSYLTHIVKLSAARMLRTVEEYKKHEAGRERSLYQMAVALGWQGLARNGKLTPQQWDKAIEQIAEWRKEGKLTNGEN
jgi:hypothetical protein